MLTSPKARVTVMEVVVSDLVLVTGSSRGIGAAIATAYGARPDTTVLINYLRDRDGAERTASAVREAGSECVIYRADVSQESAVVDLAARIKKDFASPLTTLVNNAGQIIRPAHWLEATGEDVRRTVALNLEAGIWTCRCFVPGMISAQRGHVVNLCTTYAINGAAAVLAYTAAKAGVATLTTALAAEVGQHGVRVNGVAPGNIDTQMTRSAGDDVVQWSVDTTPLGRLGLPEEIAQAVIFLEDAKFITGEIVKVDGGQILKI